MCACAYLFNCVSACVCVLSSAGHEQMDRQSPTQCIGRGAVGTPVSLQLQSRTDIRPDQLGVCVCIKRREEGGKTQKSDIYF